MRTIGMFVEQYYQNQNDDSFTKLEKLKKHAPIGNAEEIIAMRDEGRK